MPSPVLGVPAIWSSAGYMPFSSTKLGVWLVASALQYLSCLSRQGLVQAVSLTTPSSVSTLSPTTHHASRAKQTIQQEVAYRASAPAPPPSKQVPTPQELDAAVAARMHRPHLSAARAAATAAASTFCMIVCYTCVCMCKLCANV
jgi:hypothetical protein